MFFDPSLLLLWGCAVTCLWYGSVRSFGFFSEVKETAPQEIKFVQSKKVIALPIIGSIVLLLLFFFLDFSITVWILIGLVALVVVISQFFIFAPLADYIFDKLLFKSPKGFTIPKVGFIPVSGLILFAYCLGVVALWICTSHWLVVDIIAWCMAVTQMCVLRLPSLKISTLLLVPFLIYDVFWVFVSPVFFHGTSVMVSVAMRLPDIPLFLTIPHLTNFGDWSGLGLGDIVLPGFFVVFLYSFDEHLGNRDVYDLKNWRNTRLSYFTWVLIEYTLGYVLTILVGSIMDSGQPALLYLVPCTLGPTAYIAYRRGELRLMWTGQHNASPEAESKSLLESGEGEKDENEADQGENENVVVNLGPLDPREVAVTELHSSLHESDPARDSSSLDSSSLDSPSKNDPPKEGTLLDYL